MDAKSPQELLGLAKDAGMELSDEQLEAVSGGTSWDCFDICDAHEPARPRQRYIPDEPYA